MIATLCLVPLIGALCSALVGRRSDLAARQLAIAFALATLVAAIIAAVRFDQSGTGFQESYSVEWISRIGVHLALGVDGMALLLILLTAALVPIVMLTALRSHTYGWFAWALALSSFALVVFSATDVFLFYVFFEATLIPAYFMIGGYGRTSTPRRSGAALKFLMYQLGGGLVLLGGVIGLYAVQSGQGAAPSYLITDLQHLDIGTVAGRWIFVAFFIGFAVKAPLFPFHTWLADASESATPQTSVLLVCVLDKIGTFGMLRFCLGLLPEASSWATPVVVTLCLISIVYGAFLAIGQDDLLRLIGLTSLSHFGFIALGIFVLTPTGGGSAEGASGAIIYMVNHGVATAAMFLVAAYLIERRGTASIRAIRGVERSAPVLAGLLLVAGLATAGLPGLSQFVSEILVIIGAFAYHWWVGAIAVTAVVLAAIYVLWMYQRTMTGPPGLDTRRSSLATHSTIDDGRVASASEPGAGRVASASERIETTADLTRTEVAIVAPLMIALVLFGFYPAPLLDLANPVISAVAR